MTLQDIAHLVQKMIDAGADLVGMENLYTFNGHPGYTVSQDEQ